MGKYYVVESRKNDEWIVAECESREEAIKSARFEWGNLTRAEKSNTTVEVRIYEDDIESEDCSNFDYSTIAWGYIIRDKEAGNMIEYLLDIHDVQNTLENYIKEDAEEDLPASEQELLDFYEVIDLATGERMTIEWWECNQEVNVY